MGRGTIDRRRTIFIGVIMLLIIVNVVLFMYPKSTVEGKEKVTNYSQNVFKPQTTSDTVQPEGNLSIKDSLTIISTDHNISTLAKIDIKVDPNFKRLMDRVGNLTKKSDPTDKEISKIWKEYTESISGK